MKKDYVEDVSAFITSALSLAIGFGFEVPEDAAKLFGSIAPVVQRMISRVLVVFQGKSFAKIESARLGVCYYSLVESIKKNEANGNPYNESFFSHELMYGKIDEVAESVLRAAMDDSQNVKAFHYGRLLGNALYQSEYDESSIFLLLKIAKQLSYDELCLLAVLYDMPTRNYEKLVGAEDKRTELMINMLTLIRFGLVNRVPPYFVGATLDSLNISAFGKDLYRLMELKELNPEDVGGMRRLIELYVMA